MHHIHISDRCRVVCDYVKISTTALLAPCVLCTCCQISPSSSQDKCILLVTEAVYVVGNGSIPPVYRKKNSARRRASAGCELHISCLSLPISSTEVVGMRQSISNSAVYLSMLSLHGHSHECPCVAYSTGPVVAHTGCILLSEVAPGVPHDPPE